MLFRSKYDGNKYWMHDLLQQMGQDMVRRDCPLEPEKWSKLWLYKDIRSVLMKNIVRDCLENYTLSCYSKKLKFEQL